MMHEVDFQPLNLKAQVNFTLDNNRLLSIKNQLSYLVKGLRYMDYIDYKKQVGEMISQISEIRRLL